MKVLFEFALYKPVMCKLPQRLGWGVDDHEMHAINIVGAYILISLRNYRFHFIVSKSPTRDTPSCPLLSCP